MSKEKSSKRSYSAEFKDQAVKMVIGEKRRLSEVARDLGIPRSALENWIARFKKTGRAHGVGRGKSRHSEADQIRIKKLEAELKDVKMERDILKKAAAYFARESK